MDLADSRTAGSVLVEQAARAGVASFSDPPLFDFASIERTLRAEGLSKADLLLEAGVSKHTFRLCKRAGHTPRQSTLRKLNAALARLRMRAPTRRPPNAVRGLIHATENMLLARIQKSKKLIPIVCNRDHYHKTVRAGRLRALAIYLVAVEIEVSNAEIARALDTSRENPRKARDTIEDLRQAEPRVDRLLTQCAALLKGEAA